jgi:hypothetical protein
MCRQIQSRVRPAQRHIAKHDTSGLDTTGAHTSQRNEKCRVIARPLVFGLLVILDVADDFVRCCGGIDNMFLPPTQLPPPSNISAQLHITKNNTGAS